MSIKGFNWVKDKVIEPKLPTSVGEKAPRMDSKGPKGDVLKNNISEINIKLPDGPVADNYNRFFKKIPSNSKENVLFKICKDGTYLFEATSAGKIPGSKAVYQKWVNSQGETLKLTKTTYGPSGEIIHVKPKYWDENGK